MIVSGLKGILEDARNGKISWSIDSEDIHMNVESILINRIGEAGKKLHTGRSRNDQVALDNHMIVMLACRDAVASIKDLICLLIRISENNLNTAMPGFTHLQHAQPITLAHHLMAYTEMLLRDIKRFQNVYEEADEMLGALTILTQKDCYADQYFKANYWQCKLTYYSDFISEENGTEVTITAYRGHGSIVVIPEEIDGKPVTCIGREAFLNATGIVQVSLPYNLRVIEDGAFKGCNWLNSIHMLSVVDEIGESIFEGCENLRIAYVYKESPEETYMKEYYPDISLVMIMSVRFVTNSRTELEDLYLTPGKRINKPEIENGRKALVGWFSDATLTKKWDFANDVIPRGGVTLFAAWADPFAEETAFILPDSLVKIEAEAFRNDSMKVVDCPTTLLSVGANAFAESSLTQIRIPNKEAIIDVSAFTGCESVTVYMPEESADALRERFSAAGVKNVIVAEIQ